MMNGRPLSRRAKAQILVFLTIIAWATQTLVSQWTHGAEIPVEAGSGEHFVPNAARLAAGGTLELRAEATVFGPEVRLRQICRWNARDSQTFVPVADLVITRIEPKSPYRSITVAEVRQTLADAGVNIGLVRFCGPMSCTVNRSDTKPEPADALEQWVQAKRPELVAPVPAPAQPIAAPSTRPAAVASLAEAGVAVRTLRELLTQDLSIRLATPADQLQISFNPKDDGVLNLSEPQFRFNLEPQRVRGLGEISWIVTVVAESKAQKTTIVAQARAWQNQIVVNRPISARQVIRSEDVIEKRVLVDRSSDEPLLTSAQAIGQQASRELKPGMVITSRLVEAVPLAKPGQLISVTFVRGTIQIKTVAKALEAGSYGQAIKVKNEATNDMFEVILTGPQEGTIGQPNGLASR